MTQKNKLPEQKIKSLNLYKSNYGKRKFNDTDTTSVTTSSISSTHIFNH